MNADSTIIKSLTANFKIINAGLESNNIDLKSGLFDLKAKGRIGFDTQLNLAGEMIFGKSFSSSLQRAVKELDSIINDQGHLVIPVKIKGSASKPKMYPDTSKLLKSGVGDLLKKEGAKLLEKEGKKLLGKEAGKLLEGEGGKLLKGLFGG